MLKKVISGGQIGADIAGLRAAKKCGLETGGYMPKGFRTVKGPKEAWAKKFGLEEHEDWRYPARTRENVRASDATICLALDFTTPGERATLRELRNAHRRYLDIDLNHPISTKITASWLISMKVEVLNIAGNGKEEIEELVERYLIKVFKRVLDA
jgi:hypothetical protein